MTRARSVLTAAVVTAAAVAGCGGEQREPGRPAFDRGALEASLTRTMARQTGAIVDRMVCPVRAPRPGATFECSASFDNEAGLVVVTLTGPSARPDRYRARMKNVLLGKMERAIQARLDQLGTPVASVDCPGPVPQRRGQVSHCNVADNRGRTARLRVTQTDERGNISFRQVARQRAPG